MQRTKVKCSICGQEISVSNMSKHLRRHNKHPETFKPVKYALTHDGLNCQFCNKLCKNRNSLCNHERLCSKNPNKQDSAPAFLEYNKNIQLGLIDVWNKGLTKETDERVAKHSESIKAYYTEHDGVWLGKKHTEETKKKIGEGVKKFLENNPEMIPYKRNHSSKESYPEEYFTTVFENENIKLNKQYRFHSYTLDFCNVDKKIDIEVDGDQHYLDPVIIEHDKKRNKFLHDAGWTVFRIRWSEYKKMNEEEKRNIIEEIKKLLI